MRYHQKYNFTKWGYEFRVEVKVKEEGIERLELDMTKKREKMDL